MTGKHYAPKSGKYEKQIQTAGRREGAVKTQKVIKMKNMHKKSRISTPIATNLITAELCELQIDADRSEQQKAQQKR